MDKEEKEILEKANKAIIKYLRIVELCNLYRLHNETEKEILDEICELL